MVDFVKLGELERRWKQISKELECGCDMLFASYCENATYDIHGDVVLDCGCECHYKARQSVK